MGVYIKGQDLPKEGEHYLIQINSDGTVYDAVGRRIAAQAVPVPPHGRLIEKGVLLYKCYQHFEDFMLGKVDGKTALLNIEKEIKAAPTIIPASGGKEDE